MSDYYTKQPVILDKPPTTTGGLGVLDARRIDNARRILQGVKLDPTVGSTPGDALPVHLWRPVGPAPVIVDSPQTSTPAAPNSPAPAGNDRAFEALLASLTTPASAQLPAQYPGGRVYVTPGTSGGAKPAPALLIVLALIGGAVWFYLKSKGGK